jgi:hypothetical protein
MAAESVVKEVLDQRKFLHDIANPLATVIFLVDSITHACKNANPPVDPKIVDRLGKAAASLERMKVMLQDRRSALISAGETAAAGEEGGSSASGSSGGSSGGNQSAA